MAEEMSRDLCNMCQNLKRLREKKGYSLLELSQRTQIQEPILQRLEAIDVPDDFDVDELFRICVCLKVQPSKIFEEPEANG